MRSPLLVIGLVAMGLIAAVSAALLVAFIKVNPVDQVKEAMNRDVTVVVVREALPASTVVKEEHLESATVKASEAPEGYLTAKSLAVGNVLVQPVEKEQVLTKGLFARDGTGKSLAGKLPGEKRAMTLQLSTEAAIVSLIHPGCFVDVLASFDLERNSGIGSALSTTLVDNVEVLAVNQLAVGAEEPEDTVAPAQSRREVLVTLEVDPEQAKALHLAQLNGDVSLMLRNPVAGQPDEGEPMVLNEGQLARLGKVMDDQMREQLSSVPPVMPPAMVVPEPEPEPEPVAPAPPAAEASDPVQVELFRGVVKEICTFDSEGGRI